MKERQLIRFKKSARDGEFKKGDFARVEFILGEKPYSQDDIYVVRLKDKVDQVWVVGSEIEEWNQLSLWE